MDSLFQSTRVVLTTEFVKIFSAEDFASTLRDVRGATGVDFSTVSSETATTFALAGTWEQISAAYEFLEKRLEKENNKNDVGQNCSKESTNKNFDDNINQSKDEVTRTLTDGQESDCNNKMCNIIQSENKLGSELLHGHGSELNEEIKIPEQSAESICSLQDDINAGKNKSLIKKSARKGINTVRQKRNIKLHKNHTSKADNTNQEALNTGDKQVPAEVKSRINNSKDKNDRSLSTGNKARPLTMITNNENDKLHNGNTNQNSDDETSTTIIIVEQDAKKKVRKRKPGDTGYWSRVKIRNYNEQHKCEHCDVVLKSRKRYMEHLRRIHIKEFQCEVCQRRFGYPTDLHRHKCVGVPDPDNEHKRKGGRPKKEKSTEPVFLPCPECDYIGSSRKRFNGHVRRTHRLSFKCDQCNKKFGFVRDLQRHKENVHAGPSHFCDKCSKMYKSKAVFDLHLKTHEEGYQKPKYECQVCGKAFTTKYVLTTHVKTDHLGIKKTYLCQVCGKSFKQRNSYKQHLNAHAGIKPYVCDLCGKAFTYHKSLKEHKFMHDTIRRFQCQLCEKTFRQRTTLQIHMKVHKTIKDHICATCGKGFSQKQALERHERIHTGVKPYTCIPCQKTFGDSSTIRRHMLAKHQKSEQNWREGIICNIKSRTDYYVTGGSGHNRTLKTTKAEAKTDIDKYRKTEKIPANTEPKYQTLNNVDTALLMLNTGGASVDFSNMFIPSANLDQIQSLSESLQASLSNGSYTQMNPTSPLYSMSTSHSQQQPQQQSAHTTTPMNHGNSLANFNGLAQMKLQIDQHPQMGKIILPIASQHQQQGFQPQQQDQQLQQQQSSTVGSSNGVLHETSLMSGVAVTDSVSTGQSCLSGDAVLSQSMANIWGFVGYPAFQSTSSNTPYPTQ